MKNFDTRVHNISDFVEWHERGQLELSPEFQRRSVWSAKAKSYLVDTILRGKPMPKLLFTQEMRDRRNIRVVVDGQQRLRSILEFVANEFRVSRAHNKEFAGRFFKDLPADVQVEFLKYEVGVDLLYGMPYKDILDIFARINTYTARLNTQELLNSQYVGYFKQLAYDLGYSYVDYLLASGVLTKASVTRMSEAELTSDLLVSICESIQTNKSVENYYKKYEDDFENVDEVESKFNAIMAVIAEIYPAKELANTNWARVHLFYTLFTAIGHGLYGLRGADAAFRPDVGKAARGKLRISLDNISAQYDKYVEMLPNTEGTPTDFADFIQKSRRATTDTGSRTARTNFVCRRLVADAAK